MLNSNNSIPFIAQNVNTKVCIDRVPYRAKPPKTDIGGIVNRLKCSESVHELTPYSLVTDYITKGYTFTHAELNGRKTENWVSQSYFISDIDNDRDDVPMLTQEDCKEILEARGIRFLFSYYTFSDSPAKRKFRMVLLCEEIITDPTEAMHMMAGLHSLFSQGDPACVELPRMFYGTNNPSVEWGGGMFKKQQLLDLYHERVEPNKQEPVREYKEYTRTERHEGDLDLAQAYREFDLAGYVAQTTGSQGKRRGKDICFNPCPVCGHNDDFFVDTASNLFKCHSSANGTGGNILTYLMITRGMSKEDARAYFKYDILGVDRNAEKQAYIKSLAKKDIERMTTDAGITGFTDEDLMQQPWVQVEWNEKKKRNDVTILPSELAKFWRERTRYIFVKDQTKSEPQRFFYVGGYYKQVSDDEMIGYIKAFIPYQYYKHSQAVEVQKQLYTDVGCFYSQKDINPERYINFQNGIFDLDAWQLIPHSPDILCTIQIPCDYVPNCPAPETGYFDRTIKHLSTNNAEVERLILQFMGVTLSNVYGWRMKKGLFMVSKKGDTGKSLMKELLTRLIGEQYVSGADLSEIEKPFGGSRIYNKRLVGSDDMSYASINEITMYKKLTGGGTIDCEFKGETAFPYKFQGVLWFCMNKLPKFGGDKGEHVYDRIVTIRCENPVQTLDRQLNDKLYSEREYIVYRAIEALKRVLDNGYEYDIPFICQIENMEYRTENNSVLRFLQECTIPREGYNPEKPQDTRIRDNCTIKRCYDVYVAWCKENNGGHTDTKSNFKTILADEGKGFEKKTKGFDYWAAFTLTQEAKDTYHKAYDFWQETQDVYNAHAE